MNFYTPQDALDYLKGKIADLFAARATLQDQYGRALLARSKSQTPSQISQADQLVADITTSLQDQSSLESKVKAVVPNSWMPQTLGIFPLIVGIGAIAVAGAVYLHLQQISQHAKTLSLIEKGIITPAQAVQLEQSSSILGAGGLTDLTGNMKWILLGGLGLYSLFLFGRR